MLHWALSEKEGDIRTGMRETETGTVGHSVDWRVGLHTVSLAHSELTGLRTNSITHFRIQKP